MPSNPLEERQDSQRNRAKIQKEVARIIRKEMRKPTVQELVEATGLSDKTVKAHLKRVKLGDGAANVFQQLTPHVVLKLYERAVGYSHPAVKFLTVSGGAGAGSSVEEKEYTEYYPPDTAAAKLWFQLVEGYREKTETEVKAPGGFTFNYVVPTDPTADGQ
jgi:DNA-binding transcriptional ArsR family regulator